MIARCIFAILLCWPTIAAAQVTGRFYLQKNRFAPGEPVFLYFEATNSGTELQNIRQADPYSFCSGYKIRVSTDADSNSSCALTGVGGSCLSSDVSLGPGKSRTERILLNYDHQIDAPGYYELEAVRQLPYVPAAFDYYSAAKTILEVHQQLHFWVDENAVPDDPHMDHWIEQLHSADPASRREAAQTLATMAPKSAEDILLSFADNPEFKPWAPLAFHGLNTPRSLASMAELLRKTEPGTWESMQSANFLGETSDPKWFPLLLEVAQKNPKISNYVDDAAESGGDQILPVLFTLMRSADEEFTRPNAISAFGYTGSRAAVPILLALLRSPDSTTAESALYGLRQLTHRSLNGESWFDNPESQYPKWLQWWNREGASAQIYKATECGEVTPLE
ncbi:MAG: HEAT repeat domain-containing protein [Candidatus Acidiferrales bacterium]